MKSKLIYLGRGVLNLVLVLAILSGFQLLIRRRVPATVGMFSACVLLVVLYLAGVRYIERRRPSELLDKRWLKEFLSGIALGLSLFTAVMLALWIAGTYHPASWGSPALLARGFLLALVAAVVEEIIFRGFLFRLSAKLFGTWGALVLTSVLFGAAHASNPGATVGSSVAIALEAGILLGAAYAMTQRLWLPIGLHLGWNFAEGSIFGMSVSGTAKQASLITGSLHGRNLLTGGAFGPEASILAVIICLAASIYLITRTVRLARLEPPIWSKLATAPPPPLP